MFDASAALSALLNDGHARRTLAVKQSHVPHLVDAEIASALRRRVAAGEISSADGWTTLDTWRRLGLVRYPGIGLMGRVWELSDNVSAYDAMYVALAELLGCPLLTADARLSRAPGLRCELTVVPR